MLFNFHLNELKYRFLYFLFSFFITWIIFFSYKFFFFTLFSKHFTTNSTIFIFTYLSEALTSFLWFSAFLTIIFLLPILLYHIYQFLILGFYPHEKVLLKQKFLLLNFLLYLSLLFNWTFLLPYFSKLLLYNNVNTLIEFSPKISEYVSFIIMFSISILILTVFPIILLSYIDNTYLTYVYKYRLHFYFVISLCLSFLTPPDLFLVLASILFFILFLEILFLFNCLRQTVPTNSQPDLFTKP